MTERSGVEQVSEAEAREIRGSFRDLFVTLREVFVPPTIQLRRRSESTGNFADAGTPFQPAAMTLPPRQVQDAGANTGRISVERTGTMHVDATRDIRRDDRFLVDGQWARVTFVAPEVNAIGYVPVDFTVEG